MRLAFIVLGLAIITGDIAEAQSCRKICYSTEIKNKKGCCVKGTRKAKPTEAEKKKIVCPAGQTATDDTAGNCCWPGQAWAGSKCRGVPSSCPSGMAIKGEECTVKGCAEGKERAEDGVHCCWPGQAWHKGRKKCLGIPTACPAGQKVRGEDCVAAGIGGWIALKGGAFGMGSMGGDRDEKPVHAVQIGDFSITKTEVTVGQYKTCVDAGKCTPPGNTGGCTYGQADKDDHPVNCVSWKQAKAFCKYGGGRLPTEAEWEFAARGRGGPVTYPWGERRPTCQYAIMKSCRGRQTSPVCTRTPGHTADGLCDMAGNVWEWTADWYGAGYYKDSGELNPKGPEQGKMRVRRGGSFADAALRTTDRNAGDPTADSENLGFRCAR